jgi:hypothetical protein
MENLEKNIQVVHDKLRMLVDVVYWDVNTERNEKK